MDKLTVLDAIYDGLKFKDAVYSEKTNVCTVDFLFNPDSFKPTLLIVLITSRLIGFLRIHSIITNIIWKPSNAGIGNKLNTARLTAISGNKRNKKLKLCIVIVAILLIVVTGPPNAVIESLPVSS